MFLNSLCLKTSQKDLLNINAKKKIIIKKRGVNIFKLLHGQV